MTDARLSLLALPREPNAFELTRFVEGASAPLDLHGSSLRLFVRQIIDVNDGHCQTESYAYRLQSDDSLGSWLLRWEYLRDPPRPDYAYPAAHVHVNGTWGRSEVLGRLHIPTRRVPLELVVWHLIADWSVTPKTDDWQAILRESIEGFDERQTTR
ncbi:MAG: hypothetical protein ACYDHH_09655 [Solirubrobacteraceae bacterium]